MTTDPSRPPCGVRVLHVRTTAFDLPHLPALGALFDRVLALRPAQVVADLSACRYIDAAGVGLLLDVHRRLTRVGAVLTVHDPNPGIRRILQITGVDQVLPVTTTAPDRGVPHPRAGLTTVA
ncbi:STAS domain-containing protein [Micromonospora endolithica]|uniref:Anti-sigma factor antagonist n=1 Tax=Micromonospora endolithica TaxID=230091 RepID=A0A3A9ZKP0_9ACTN|nr:STAS domain-containing protein [Micromonospora endolithica]RKN47846.1 anti-sigma factor antagonist [Micromonospora endolithica]TWJ21537.1 anti-anti-sigma factor [Micromonospora endolithica]